jgi:tetratricopeptide (TPR) repeat protein
MRMAAAELKAATERAATQTDLEEFGRVLENLGRPTDAIAAYTRALDLIPAGADRAADRVRVLVTRGWARLNLSTPDLDGGRADFDAALGLAPESAEAHTGLGYVEACRGEAAAARRAAQRAVLYGSGDFLILHNVACVFAKVADGEPAAAREGDELALDYLRRSVGLWRRDRSGPNELVNIRNESAFGPRLRARPEFKALLADE